MRPFNEVLREVKQGERPAVTVNVVNPEDLVNPVVRNRIPKRNRQKPQPQGPALPSSAQRAKRFSQSFGTPTGANPFTGRATYIPPTELTKLPPSVRSATADPEAYSRVTPGDLETKRNVRTAEVPGKPGVRAATPKGVENFVMSQGGFARPGRNMPASEFTSRRAEAQRIAANPNSPEFEKIAAQINQEVGGRRAKRGRNTPAGRAADAAFRQKLDLDTPEGAAANRDFAKEMERLRRQNKGERDLLAAIDDVDAKPSGRQGSQGRRPAVSVSQTPSQVIANTQQSGRLKKVEVATKVEPPKGHNAKIRPGAKPVPVPAAPTPKPVSPTSSRLQTPKNLNQLIGQVKKSTSVTSAKLTVPAVTTPVKAAPVAAAVRATSKAGKPKAPKVKVPKVAPSGLKTLARGASAFAAYTDFNRGRQDVLARGGGNRRADAEGAVRAASSFVGGGLGFALGTPLGPVGQTVTGTLGYQKAGDAGVKLFRAATGSPGQKVTMKSVEKNLKNIYRQSAPEPVKNVVNQVRAATPEPVKKTLRQFVGDTVRFGAKLYKAKRRFDRITDLTQGETK